MYISGIKDVNADHAASHIGRAQGLATVLRAIPYNAQHRRVNLPLDIMAKVSQTIFVMRSREISQKSKHMSFSSDFYFDRSAHLKSDILLKTPLESDQDSKVMSNNY